MEKRKITQKKSSFETFQLLLLIAMLKVADEKEKGNAENVETHPQNCCVPGKPHLNRFRSDGSVPQYIYRHTPSPLPHRTPTMIHPSQIGRQTRINNLSTTVGVKARFV